MTLKCNHLTPLHFKGLKLWDFGAYKEWYGNREGIVRGCYWL